MNIVSYLWLAPKLHLFQLYEGRRQGWAGRGLVGEGKEEGDGDFKTISFFWDFLDLIDIFT